MIDFRYHIVSLVGVFLALALGILLGSSVVSGPLEARLRGDLERAREARSEAQNRERELDRELSQLKARQHDQVGPWATRARLDERPILVVAEPGTEAWREDTVRRLIRAGAVPSGSMLFREPGVENGAFRAELVERVRNVVPGYEPGEDPMSSAMRLLGERLLEPTGPALAAELAEGGWLEVDRAGSTEELWPPREVAVVVFGQERVGEDRQSRWTAAFARGAAATAPTLVLAPEPASASAVGVLRDEGEVPPSLVTFDTAGPEGDPGAIGVVAALEAALLRRGGHFGTGPGTRFVPAQ